MHNELEHIGSGVVANGVEFTVDGTVKPFRHPADRDVADVVTVEDFDDLLRVGRLREGEPGLGADQTRDEDDVCGVSVVPFVGFRPPGWAILGAWGWWRACRAGSRLSPLGCASQLGTTTNLGPTSSSNPVPNPTPARVPSLDDVTTISAGYGHTLVVRSDGTVWGFGYNAWGQIGRPAAAPSGQNPRPEPIDR